MKALITLLSLLILVSSFISSCKKENDEQLLYYHRFTDLISSGINSKVNVDCDGDSVPDLELKTYFGTGYQQLGPYTLEYYAFSKSVSIVNSAYRISVGIRFGSYPYGNGYTYDIGNLRLHEFSPVDSACLWIKGTVLHGSGPYGGYGDWPSDQTLGYIGLRKQVGDTYRYGWIKIGDNGAVKAYEVAMEKTDSNPNHQVLIGKVSY
jgi:hypothetical protein